MAFLVRLLLRIPNLPKKLLRRHQHSQLLEGYNETIFSLGFVIVLYGTTVKTVKLLLTPFIVWISRRREHNVNEWVFKTFPNNVRMIWESSKVFIAVVAILRYSALNLIQNTGKVVVWNTFLTLSPFAISSSESSSCIDKLQFNWFDDKWFADPLGRSTQTKSKSFPVLKKLFILLILLAWLKCSTQVIEK